MQQEDAKEDASEALFSLLSEWYGCPPRLSKINALKDEQLQNLWNTLWSA